MNCHEIRIKADAFVDRELKTNDHDRIQNHVRQCQACKMWVDMVQRARDTVRTKVVKREAPDGLEARIRSEVGRAREGRWPQGGGA